jgi:hypothetical protein
MPQAPAAPQQQQLKPLAQNTRQRYIRSGNPLAYTGFNQLQQMNFTQVGYVDRLIVQHSFQITDTAAVPATAAAAAGLGPWSLVKRLTLQTNLGTSTVFDTSGWGAFQVGKLYDRDVDLGTAYGTADTVDPLFAYPVTGYVQNVAKTINFCHVIPVALNDGDQFTIGLLNLQAPEIQATLSINIGQPADILATADTLTLTGTSTVFQEFYEVPNPAARVAAPKRILHRWVEDGTTPITVAGENIYTLPRQGKLLRLVHWAILNGVLDTKTADVLQFNLVANQTDFIYRKDTLSFLIEQRIRYGLKALPPGVYAWDFFNASQAVNRGGNRDIIDTQKISVLESRCILASGVVLGANNNQLAAVRNILQGY